MKGRTGVIAAVWLKLDPTKMIRSLRAACLGLGLWMKLLPDRLKSMGDGSRCGQFAAQLGRLPQQMLRIKNSCRQLKLAPWLVHSIEGVILLYLVLLPVWQSEPFWLYGLLYLLAWSRPKGKADYSVWELPAVGLVLALGALLTGAGPSTLKTLGEYECALLLAWLISRSFTPGLCRKVIDWWLISSVIWMAIGLGQQFVGIPTPPGWLGPDQVGRIAVRSYAVFSNPNIYAIYLASIFGFVICWHEAVALKWRRWLTRVIFLLVVVSLYFTYSRSGWLLAALLLSWRWRRHRSKINCKPWLLLVLLAVLLLVPGGFQTRLSGLLTGCDSSINYRLRIWKGVGRILQAHWFWGAGPGSFNQIYPPAQSGAPFSWHAHSFYLQFWLEFGLGPLLLGTIWSGAVLIRALRVKAEPVRQAVMLGIMCLLGGGLTESWQVSRFCREYCGLLVGMLLALQHKEQEIDD